MPHWLKTNLGLIFFFSTNVGTPDYCRYHQITVGSHHMTASSHHFRDHQNISHPNLTCLYLKRYQSLISSPIVSYFSLREISLSFFFFFSTYTSVFQIFLLTNLQEQGTIIPILLYTSLVSSAQSLQIIFLKQSSFSAQFKT